MTQRWRAGCMCGMWGAESLRSSFVGAGGTMSRTSLEAVRRWFLGLPQLQKTLVFGGLGLVSGWVTTAAFQVFGRAVTDMTGIVRTALVAPGLAFGFLVAGPIYILSAGTRGGWLQSLVRVVTLHPAALMAFVMMTVHVSPTSPAEKYVAAAIVGGSFGFLLAGSCAPGHWFCDEMTAVKTSVGMAIAAELVTWMLTLDVRAVLGLAGSLEFLLRTALIFVTLHTTAAICFSWRDWPAVADASPPPLDDSATLPP